MKDSSVDKLAETLSLCILKKGKIKKKKNLGDVLNIYKYRWAFKGIRFVNGSPTC